LKEAGLCGLRKKPATIPILSWSGIGTGFSY
jgi:hypothetical protein